MYLVIKNGKKLSEGTLTQCLELIATQMSEFHPEAVTVAGAMKAGYRMNRV